MAAWWVQLVSWTILLTLEWLPSAADSPRIALSGSAAEAPKNMPESIWQGLLKAVVFVLPPTSQRWGACIVHMLEQTLVQTLEDEC